MKSILVRFSGRRSASGRRPIGGSGFPADIAEVSGGFEKITKSRSTIRRSSVFFATSETDGIGGDNSGRSGLVSDTPRERIITSLSSSLHAGWYDGEWTSFLWTMIGFGAPPISRSRPIAIQKCFCCRDLTSRPLTAFHTCYSRPWIPRTAFPHQSFFLKESLDSYLLL